MYQDEIEVFSRFSKKLMYAIFGKANELTCFQNDLNMDIFFTFMHLWHRLKWRSPGGRGHRCQTEYWGHRSIWTNKQTYVLDRIFKDTWEPHQALIFLPPKKNLWLKVWRPIVPDRSDLVTVWHLTDAQHIAKLLYQTFLFLVSLHFWEYYVELQVVVLRRNFQRWQNSLWGCTCFLFK